MEQQQRQGEEPRERARLAARGGNIADFLPFGSYVCPTRGEAKAVYGDYRRLGGPPKEEEIAAAPMEEFSEEEHLLPGAYVCPTKGEAKRAYGDYRRIGDPGTFI